MLHKVKGDCTVKSTNKIVSELWLVFSETCIRIMRNPQRNPLSWIHGLFIVPTILSFGCLSDDIHCQSFIGKNVHLPRMRAGNVFVLSVCLSVSVYACVCLGYKFWNAWPRNFIFGLIIHLDHIWVIFEY